MNDTYKEVYAQTDDPIVAKTFTCPKCSKRLTKNVKKKELKETREMAVPHLNLQKITSDKFVLMVCPKCGFKEPVRVQ